jgi:hypothetical protein
MRKITLFFLLICILCSLIFIYSKRKADRDPSKTASPPVPRTDKDPLKKRFPFLGDFARCSWIGGVKDDRSGGRLPAPSSHFIRAHVVLEPSQTRELLGRYVWAESKGEAIPEPPYPLGEGFPKIAGPFSKSDDLIRELPSMTTYAGGTILLQAKGDLLYLDLVSD